MQKPTRNTTATNPIRVVGRRSDLKKCSALRFARETQRYASAFFMARSPAVWEVFRRYNPSPVAGFRSRRKTHPPAKQRRGGWRCREFLLVNRTPSFVHDGGSKPDRTEPRPAPANGTRAERQCRRPRVPESTVLCYGCRAGP